MRTFLRFVALIAACSSPLRLLQAQYILPTYQERRVYHFPAENRLRLHLEASAIAGIALPTGKFARIGIASQPNENALRGYWAEAQIQHRFRRNALWSVLLPVGITRNPYRNTTSLLPTRLDFSYSHLGSDWQAIYAMPSLAFRGGVRWKFELSAGLGVGAASGGVMYRATWQPLDTNPAVWTKKEIQWTQRGAQILSGYRASLSLGYLFGSRWGRWQLAAVAGYLHLSGKRSERTRENLYRWDDNTQNVGELLLSGEFPTVKTLRLQNFTFGIQLKYHAYRTLYPHTRTRDGIIYH